MECIGNRHPWPCQRESVGRANSVGSTAKNDHGAIAREVNGLDWSRTWRALAATIVALCAMASAAQVPEQSQTIAFLPSASDDEGDSYGLATLSIGAREAVQFTSHTLGANAQTTLGTEVGFVGAFYGSSADVE